MLPQILAAKLILAGLIDHICGIVPRLNLKSQMAEDFMDPHSRECIRHKRGPSIYFLSKKVAPRLLYPALSMII